MSRRSPAPGLSPPSARPPRDGTWRVLAESGPLALGLALALSTGRLFSGAGPATVTVGLAVVAWALAAGLGRLRLRAGTAMLIHLSVGALLLLAVAMSTERPPGSSGEDPFSAITRIVREDFSSFSTDVAPVPAGPGHMVIIGALVWLLAAYASYAAMRVRSPVQGAVPHVVAILGLGLLAREEARATSTVVLLVALAYYCLTQAAWRNAAFRWVPRPSRGVTVPLVRGSVLLSGAVVLALVIAPFLPGDSEPVVDFRNEGMGDRTRNVISPFVEVGSNLGARSGDLLFTVRSDAPGYWRLTALDEYDPGRGIWVLSNSYEPVDGPLARSGETGERRTEVTIGELGGFWVPGVKDPLTASSERRLGWDADAGSLIVREDDLGRGDRISLTSDPLGLDDESMEGADTPSARSIDAELLDAEGTPVRLRVTAGQLAGDLPPYRAALAIQEWFRTSFTYDETVDFSGSADPLEDFLSSGKGFCQQFASAFALAARSLGLPARVVVGFTPGEMRADQADRQDGYAGAVGTYDVYGRNAHAWPEVLFEGIGWVPFEPTPGRGDPSTTEVTGVPGQQAPDPTGSPEIQEPTTTVPPPTSAPPESPGTEAPTTTAATGSADPADTSDGFPVLPAVLAAAVVAGGALLLRRHRRRRSSRALGAAGAAAPWEASLRLLATRGLRPRTGETPLEFANRVRSRLGTGVVIEPARIESKRRWSADLPGEQDLASARASVALLESFLEEGPSAVLEREADLVGSRRDG